MIDKIILIVWGLTYILFFVSYWLMYFSIINTPTISPESMTRWVVIFVSLCSYLMYKDAKRDLEKEE